MRTATPQDPMKPGDLQIDTRPLLSAQTVIAMAFNALKKPMYEGTVPAGVVAQRRKKNRLARAARRRQRLSR